MKTTRMSLASLVASAILASAHSASAQTSPAIPAAITTPDRVETRLGTLDFILLKPVSGRQLMRALDEIARQLGKST